MSTYRSNRGKVLRANATVSGSSDTVIAAQSGMAISITQIVSANTVNGVGALSLYEGNTLIAPTFALGASGVLFWDETGGEQLELAIGSGLFGTASGGSHNVFVYYMLQDERRGTDKFTARNASQKPVGNNGVTRTPNMFGG